MFQLACQGRLVVATWRAVATISIGDIQYLKVLLKTSGGDSHGSSLLIPAVGREKAAWLTSPWDGFFRIQESKPGGP